MEYQAGKIYDFDIVKEFGDDEDFFRLRVPGVGEVRLTKLKFQREEPLPDKIKCRIKFVNAGIPVISHYMPQYVNRFYAQGAMSGREYDFTVISLPQRPGDPYTLEDQYGMRYNLRDDNGTPLAVGQSVSCKFTRITSTFFNLVRSRSELRLPFITAEHVLESICVRGVLRSTVLSALETLPGLTEAFEELQHQNPRWILSAIQSALDSLAQWMIESDMRRHHRLLRAVVEVIRRSALYLIEDSRFLRNQPAAQRREIQGHVTRMVEALDPYVDTLRLFRTHGEAAYLEDIMSRLSESGYLYHPDRQFSALMLILRSTPELVRKYLSSIFDTIMEWELETWTTEPFRSAFVDQFEIYIRHASSQISKLPQAESTDLVEKIVTAVALQTLIGGDTDSPRARRNRSLLYRCISLLRPDSAEALLDKAYLTINGSRIPVEYHYDHIRQPLMLMTRAAVAALNTDSIGATGTFSAGAVAVAVGPDGVSLRRTDESTDSRAIPSGVFDWKLATPQIYLDNIAPLAASKFNNLDAHRRLWADIETALFEQRTPVTHTATERRKADIGDEVCIVIDPDEISGGDDPCWRVRIDDHEFLPDSGTIFRSDIISFALRGIDLEYNRRVARSAFIHPDGAPRHFVAKVTAIGADGSYRFSMLDDINAQSDECLQFNTTYQAVITKSLDYEYSSISNIGYGLYLRREPGDPVYKPGTVVDFMLLDKQNPFHIVGTIIGEAESGAKVEKISAFANLMQAVNVEIDTDDTDASQAADTASDDASDQTIDRNHLREIIEIFRFKALSAPTLLTAYDYLLFARQLALALGDNSLADEIRTHASLLRLHQFYANNSRIDATELETYRAITAGHPLLEIMFHRLEIVSWLGKPEYQAQLWEAANDSRTNLEKSLAKLVLSFNMLPDDDDEATAKLAGGLKSKIAKLLGVNFERTTLKSYGRENQFVEFKSSIVYPARKSKTEKVEADPERQQRVILKIISSFINSSGGTLYIGVNDASRCEAGLFEDFEYYKHRKARIGTHTYDMKTADNFCVFLENLVRDTWGTLVAESVQIRIDDEASRDVIIVEVQPRTLPAKLDGRIYVRRSSSSTPLSDDEQVEFEAERAALDSQRRTALAAAAAAAQQASASTALTQVAAEVPAEAAVDTHHVPTSQWRQNVLHNYEDGYTTPSGYIYLADNDTLTYSSQDLYLDTDPATRLALVVSPDDAGAFLVMVFDHQRILKVPLAEIEEKGDNRPVGHYHDEALTFAAIGRPDDAVLTLLTDSRGNIYRRVTPLADIPSAHLNNTPDRITELPGVTDTVGVEIVDASRVEQFSGSLKSKLGPRQIGYAVKCGMSSPKAAELIKNEIRTCAPMQ